MKPCKRKFPDLWQEQIEVQNAFINFSYLVSMGYLPQDDDSLVDSLRKELPEWVHNIKISKDIPSFTLHIFATWYSGGSTYTMMHALYKEDITDVVWKMI